MPEVENPPLSVDWENPCDRYKALLDAYYATLAGGPARVRFRSGDEERETEFNKTNFGLLKQEMQSAKAECDRANGIMNTGRRSLRLGAGGPNRGM